MAAGTIASKARNHADATYAPMLKKEDGRIDWNRSAQEYLQPLVRGFAPLARGLTRLFVDRAAKCGASRCLKKGVHEFSPRSRAGRSVRREK